MTPEETTQEKISYITGKFPDAYANQYALHSWVIRSGLCGQIGLYRKTELEAWDACYDLLKSKYSEQDRKFNLLKQKQ